LDTQWASSVHLTKSCYVITVNNLIEFEGTIQIKKTFRREYPFLNRQSSMIYFNTHTKNPFFVKALVSHLNPRLSLIVAIEKETLR